MLYAWGASFIRLSACIATDPAALVCDSIWVVNTNATNSPDTTNFQLTFL